MVPVPGILLRADHFLTTHLANSARGLFSACYIRVLNLHHQTSGFNANAGKAGVLCGRQTFKHSGKVTFLLYCGKRAISQDSVSSRLRIWASKSIRLGFPVSRRPMQEPRHRFQRSMYPPLMPQSWRYLRRILGQCRH